MPFGCLAHMIDKEESMRNGCMGLLLSFVLSAACAGEAKDFTSYTEVKAKELKTAPEEYLNKNIFFATRFSELITTFLPYMDKSGFKAGKHYWLRVVPSNFPVIGEKKDKEFGDIAQDLRKRAPLAIYGKVRKFRFLPGETIFPHYYFDAEKIEMIEDKKNDALKDVDELAEEEPQQGKKLKHLLR